MIRPAVLSETVSYRAYCDDDYPLVFAITKATMQRYMEESLGPWVDEEEYRSIREKLKADCCQIIMNRGKEIGLIVVDRSPSHIQLEWLFLLPEAQQRGIGSALLKELQVEARTKALPLRLHVLTSNPARLWYQCEGFIVTEATPQRWFMEYRAS